MAPIRFLTRQQEQKVKYLLCRPMGGLNDALCQIEACVRYAKRHNRRLVVDTPEGGLVHSVFQLLVPVGFRADTTFFPGPDFLSQMNSMTTYPRVVEGAIDRYKSRRSSGAPWLEEISSAPITFDFRKSYPHDLLVHHSQGGGTLSFVAIERFRVSDYALSEIEPLLSRLPRDFNALHLRATDIQSSYHDAIWQVAGLGTAIPTLLCSDNNGVLDYATSTGTEEKFVTFPKHEVPAGIPLHLAAGKVSKGQFERGAIQLLSEIIAVAFAQQIFLAPVYSRSQWYLSGLGRLMASLARSRNESFFLQSYSGFHSKRHGRVRLRVIAVGLSWKRPALKLRIHASLRIGLAQKAVYLGKSRSEFSGPSTLIEGNKNSHHLGARLFRLAEFRRRKFHQPLPCNRHD